MARDKARDDKMFNCGQKHEIDYVADLYGENAEIVEEQLIEWCKNDVIHYSTHMEVYKLIKQELGYSIPI